MNHRTSVQTGGATTEYVFDYNGRRVSSWAEPSNAGNEGRIYWDGLPLAYRADDGTTYFQHEDYLGTERMRTSDTGAVAATFASLPWGDGYAGNIIDSGAGQDIIHFAGMDQDGNPVSDLVADHAQFRDYSFLQGLGRSLRDLIAMLDELRSRGVKFHSLTEHIDTETPTGRAMWQMIGVLAELERSMITERTRPA
jgi:hypothetical protein